MAGVVDAVATDEVNNEERFPELTDVTVPDPPLPPLTGFQPLPTFVYSTSFTESIPSNGVC
jgi:hypothetical protein